MVIEIIVAVVSILILIIKLSVVLTVKNCDSKVSMEGKVIIVTGANSGLGFETAKDLAARGGRVILACRSESLALAARDKIIEETGNTNVVYVHLDLALFKSIRNFAAHINKTEERLDVLINNAGVFGLGAQYTLDGIIEIMQINYFGAFLLTLLLLPLLKKTGSSRIINLTSTIHFFGRVNLKTINDKGAFPHLGTFADSKLCILLFTVELARRLEGTGVTVNAVHPGIIMTNISAKLDIVSRIIYIVTCWMTLKTIEEGAQAIIYLAVADECKNTTGKYFTDCRERYMTWKASNKKLTADLWDYSAKLVGLEKEAQEINN